MVCRTRKAGLNKCYCTVFTGPYNYQTAPRPPINVYHTFCRSEYTFPGDVFPPLHYFYTGSKSRDFWRYRPTSLNFESLSFQSGVRYLQHICTWRVAMIEQRSPPNLVQIGLRPFQNTLRPFGAPSKTEEKAVINHH